jgi:hypothetical protein
MGTTRQSLQAQPKILKKLSEHQIYQSGTIIFPKKYVPSKITFLSIKCSNSSRTSIKIFGFSVHEINTFITIVNRK